MGLVLSNDQVRLLRVRAQRLSPQCSDPAATVAQVVQAVGGVQAQDETAADLAVRARSTGLTVGDVEAARIQDRTVVRTWAMRGTLHLLASKDLDWLLPLVGPTFIAAGRRRRAELGLDEERSVRAVRYIRDILASHGPLTRADIAAQLDARAIRTEGQATIHLIYRAALEGLVCLGPDSGSKSTYVLLEDWVDRGSATSDDAAREMLARRYLEAYGPAAPEDLASWSGLPMSEVRVAWRAIANELMQVGIAGRPAWMLESRAEWFDDVSTRNPVVRLLPRFDTYLLGYRSRKLAVAPQYAKRIHPGGGLLHAALLVDGQALGTWTIKRHREYHDVVVEPFEQLPGSVQPELEAEVADVGRFLGTSARLNIRTPT